MSESSLRVIARGRAKEGALNAIQKVIQPLVETMQDHEYCLRYELWSSDRHPDDFVIYQAEVTSIRDDQCACFCLPVRQTTWGVRIVFDIEAVICGVNAQDVNLLQQ